MDNSDIFYKMTIFWAFSAIIFIALVGFLIVFLCLGKKGIEKPENQKGVLRSIGMLFVRSNFYIIIATILVIYIFLILSLFDKLNAQSLPVLTSIIGFVLGSYSKSIIGGEDSSKEDKTSPTIK
jgi:hypothetical protein